MSTLLEDAPTTTLEIAEAGRPEDEPSNLLHIYCGPCLRALHPERILPYCKTNRPRNDDEITYPCLSAAPPERICVVCLDFPGCPVCGER